MKIHLLVLYFWFFLHQVAEMSYEDLMQIHDSIETISPEPMMSSSSDGSGGGTSSSSDGSGGGTSSSSDGSGGGTSSSSDGSGGGSSSSSDGSGGGTSSSSDGSGGGTSSSSDGSGGGTSSSSDGSGGGSSSTCDSSTMNTDPGKHIKNTAASSSFPLFSKNNSRRPGNFVYGEINPASVANLLEIVKPKQGEVIVDLGSGAGKVCFL
jgi:hypothetical protein